MIFYESSFNEILCYWNWRYWLTLLSLLNIWWELYIGEKQLLHYIDLTRTNNGNTTEVEYISIYEQRPRSGKPRGIPKGTCKFSDEERRERARLRTKNIMTWIPRSNDKEKIIRTKTRKWKTSLENQLFLGFLKNEFPFKEITPI